MLEALAFANSSTAWRNVITYMGDGFPACPGYSRDKYLKLILSEVTPQNFNGHQIDAIAIGRVGMVNDAFFQALVDQNGGNFSVLPK